MKKYIPIEVSLTEDTTYGWIISIKEEVDNNV